MREYRKITLLTLILLAGGSALIIWGYNGKGVLRIFFGTLVILAAVDNLATHLRYIRELKVWRARNDRKLVFFYPTSKEEQIEIEKNVLPLLPAGTQKVYYDGARLAGDIKSSVAMELVYQYKKIKTNAPSVFKFVNKKLYIEDVSDLMDFRTNKTLIKIEEKINKIAKI